MGCGRRRRLLFFLSFDCGVSFLPLAEPDEEVSVGGFDRSFSRLSPPPPPFPSPSTSSKEGKKGI